jgi:hypothetical protein
MGNNSSKGNKSSGENNPPKTNGKTDIERLLDEMFNPNPTQNTDTDVDDFQNPNAQKMIDEIYNKSKYDKLNNDNIAKLSRIEVLRLGNHELPYISSYKNSSSDVISDNIIEIITCNSKLQKIIEQYKFGNKIGEIKMNKDDKYYDNIEDIFTPSDRNSIQNVEVLFRPNYNDIESINKLISKMPNVRQNFADMQDISSTSVYMPEFDMYNMRGGADSDSTTSDSDNDSTTSSVIPKKNTDKIYTKPNLKVDSDSDGELDDDLDDLDKEALDEEELSEDGMTYQSDMGTSELAQLQRLVFYNDNSENGEDDQINDLAARLFVSQTESEQGNDYDSEYTRQVRNAMQQVNTTKKSKKQNIFDTSEDMILNMNSSSDKYMKRPLKKNSKYI